METSMLSRALLATVAAAILMVALPASTAHAQVRVAAPVTHPIVSPPVLSPAGTGPYAVYFKRTGTTSASGETAADPASSYVMLGNATAVTFQTSSSPAGALAGAGRGPVTPSTAIIQFAANDQQAQALTRTACLATGCRDLVLMVTYTTAQGTTVYTLKNVTMTQMQLGTAINATFSYTEYQIQTNAQNQAQAPQASYNLGATRAQ
jgi:hypothetical protein